MVGPCGINARGGFVKNDEAGVLNERLGEAALPALTLVLVGLMPVILLSRTLRQKT